MTDAIEKANATWLTNPNQALMSVIPLGMGKSVMARRYLLVAWLDFCVGNLEPSKLHLVLDSR